MDAIKLLETQHREVEALFAKIESAGKGEKGALFGALADALAAHTTIEEQIFYPRTMAARTEDLLREAVEEHLSAKRVLADLLASQTQDKAFEAKLKVLKEQIEHHVKEEEGELFPQVKRLFKAELEEMGAAMEAMYAELQEGSPRSAVPGETSAPAPLD
jgi:hemerythrin superfamily protein